MPTRIFDNDENEVSDPKKSLADIIDLVPLKNDIVLHSVNAAMAEGPLSVLAAGSVLPFSTAATGIMLRLPRYMPLNELHIESSKSFILQVIIFCFYSLLYFNVSWGNDHEYCSFQYLHL
uniref:Transmembrane protein n=1 Tax=Ascaris lumbricoides TaxID=6252 RepID=A0A0M3HWV3_ASCLU